MSTAVTISKEKVSGIVLDDNAMKGLMESISGIRELQENQTYDTEYGREKSREIAEELFEYLDHMSGMKELSTLYNYLMAATEEYDENNGDSPSLFLCLIKIADMLDDNVHEVSEKTHMPSTNKTMFLLAGSGADIRLSVTLSHDEFSDKINRLVKQCVERIRGFVVLQSDVEPVVYEAVGDIYLSDDKMFYSHAGGYPVEYRYRFLVNVNSDVPVSAVEHQIADYLMEEGMEALYVTIKDGQMAVLGTDLKESQIFTAPKTLIEGQKQMLLGTEEKKNMYHCVIQMWVYPEAEENSIPMECTEMEEAFSYMVNALKGTIIGDIQHHTIVQHMDAGQLHARQTFNIKDGKIPFYRRFDGEETFYEAIVSFSLPKQEEISDLQIMLENAIDPDVDIIHGLTITVNGETYCMKTDKPLYYEAAAREASKTLCDVFNDNEAAQNSGLLDIIFDLDLKFSEYVTLKVLVSDSYRDGWNIYYDDLTYIYECAFKDAIAGKYESEVKRLWERVKVLWGNAL